MAKMFVVSYQVIGDRCQGQYLVCADTKTDAKQIVRDLDDDYSVRVAETEEEYLVEEDEEEYKETLAEMQAELGREIRRGDVHNLWSGT